jgi:hypothetical protein
VVRPLVQYLRDDGAPRWRKILISPESLIAVVVAVAFLRWGDRMFSQSPKIGDISTGLIAYAAIALGFCVAGLTISLTLPDQDFATKLACLKDDDEPTNAYSDLLFVFSWTAVAHWLALIVLFALTLFVEGSSPLLPAGHSQLRGIWVAATSGICAYCLCQFLITLITLSQVGNIYIGHLADCHAKKSTQQSLH